MGRVTADAIEADLDAARETLAMLERLGISLDEITAALVVDGVKQFSDAADKLLAAVTRQARQAMEGAARGPSRGRVAA